MADFYLAIVSVVILALLACWYVIADKVNKHYQKLLDEASKEEADDVFNADAYVVPRDGCKNKAQLSVFERESLARFNRMDLSNPRYRLKNQDDEWFEQNVDKFSTSRAIIAVINRSGYLDETFWRLVTKPEQNIRLQKILISVYESSLLDCFHQVSYRSMLFHYLKYYDLVEPLKEIVFTDNRFTAVRNIYESLRS
ncbi:MAG: hypothetical protein J6Y91_01250 [Alphaproteobacteria bacterium]|nr:hypothetical protein [Alphaproteobacteria bacterium]